MLQSFRSVAILVALGVLVVALFPLGAGPFTATHGPLTALRALIFAILLFVTISFVLRALVAYCDDYVRLNIQTGSVPAFNPSPFLNLRC